MSRKFLTKLLDAGYRRRVLSSMPARKMAEYKIPQYARYTVDKAIIGRDKSHAGDKEWLYGFQPLEVLAYVGKDGGIVPKLFEFNTVNHFLKDGDGDSAVEVVECILVQLAKTADGVVGFDVDVIDAGLKKIEEEYLAAEKEKEEKEKSEAGEAADAKEGEA